MPYHMLELLKQGLTEAGLTLNESRIAVLGYAYLENSDDTRHSPTQTLIQHLQPLASEVVIHDPWVPPYQGHLLEMVTNCQAVVVMVKHQAYQELDLAQLKAASQARVLVDGRRVFEPEKVRACGFVYKGIGRG